MSPLETLLRDLQTKVTKGEPAMIGGVLGEAADELHRLEKRAMIAELKASGSLANNLCPDHRDKQTGKPCLACEIERLRAALIRIANADSYPAGIACAALGLLKDGGVRRCDVPKSGQIV